MIDRISFGETRGAATQLKHLINLALREIRRMTVDPHFLQQYQQTIRTGDLADRISLLMEHGFVCTRCGTLIDPDNPNCETDRSDEAEVSSRVCEVCRSVEPTGRKPK
ncbi:MAG: hypothetical protein Fues2KO_33710 [Fuerstiella sp.]